MNPKPPIPPGPGSSPATTLCLRWGRSQCLRRTVALAGILALGLASASARIQAQSTTAVRARASTSASPSPSPAGSDATQLVGATSARVVVAQSPLLEKPANPALVDIERSYLRPGLDNNPNRETVRDTYRRLDRPLTPESAGSAVKYLRQRPSWRGLLDLVDITKPVPKPEVPAAMVFETRKTLGETPRAFVDPTRHELGIRLF